LLQAFDDGRVDNAIELGLRRGELVVLHPEGREGVREVLCALKHEVLPLLLPFLPGDQLRLVHAREERLEPDRHLRGDV